MAASSMVAGPNEVKPVGLASGNTDLAQPGPSRHMEQSGKVAESSNAEGGVAYQYAAVQQMTQNREFIEYQLTVREQPKHSRMCGVGEKADRRPIDPAPIVQLRVITHDYPVKNVAVSSSDTTPAAPPVERIGHGPAHPSTPGVRRGIPVTTSLGDGWEDKAWYLENPYYFMYAMLCHADTDEELHLLGDGKTRYTSGSCVSCLYHLKDIDGSHQGFFVFPDLSIRVEGRYRLKLCLFETIGHTVHHCKSIYSAPFNVYTAKRFPGMEESTQLSKSFADQGLKVRVRKQPRSRRRSSKRKEESRSDGSDAEMAGQAQSNHDRSPKRAKGSDGGPSPVPFSRSLPRASPSRFPDEYGDRARPIKSPNRAWPLSPRRVASAPRRIDGPPSLAGMPRAPVEDDRYPYPSARGVEGLAPPMPQRRGPPVNAMDDYQVPSQRYTTEEEMYRSRIPPPPLASSRIEPTYPPMPPRHARGDEVYSPSPAYPMQRPPTSPLPPPGLGGPREQEHYLEEEAAFRERRMMASYPASYSSAPRYGTPPQLPHEVSRGHHDSRYMRPQPPLESSVAHSRSAPGPGRLSRGATPERFTPGLLAADHSGYNARVRRHAGMEPPLPRDMPGYGVASPPAAHLAPGRPYEEGYYPAEPRRGMLVDRRGSDPAAEANARRSYRFAGPPSGLEPLGPPRPQATGMDVRSRPTLPPLRDVHGGPTTGPVGPGAGPRLSERPSPSMSEQGPPYDLGPRYPSRYHEAAGMRSVSAAPALARRLSSGSSMAQGYPAPPPPRSPNSSAGRRTPMYSQRSGSGVSPEVMRRDAVEYRRADEASQHRGWEERERHSRPPPY